jgi:hypothetical protein
MKNPLPPAILYHGTSRARLSSIQSKGLIGSWPRLYPSGVSTLGYVYLTASFEDAAIYALKTVEMEKSLSDDTRNNHGIDRGTDTGIVLSIITRELNNLEIDSESLGVAQWYKYLGDIEMRFICEGHVVAPLKDHPQSIQDMINYDLKLTSANERGAYRDFLNILTIMKRKNIDIQGLLSHQMQYDYKFFVKVMKELRYKTKYFFYRNFQFLADTKNWSENTIIN